MTHISRRSFLAATAGLAAAPAFGQSGASKRRYRDHRRRRGRDRRRPPHRGGRQAPGHLWRPPAAPAGAVSPIPAFSACPSISARTGSTCRRSIRSRNSRLPPGSMSTRRRGDSGCGSAAATRAKASLRISWPRSCAAIARSRMPRAARSTCPACRRCRRILLDLQAAVEFFLGPWGCGKDLREISAMDFAKSAERDIDAFCRQGFGTLLMKLARRPARGIVGAGHANRHIGRDRRRRYCLRQGPHQRPRRDRHGVDQCADQRQDQVHPRSAQAPARCLRQALARQLRPDHSRIARQSARPAARRPDVRESEHPIAPPRCSPMSAVRLWRSSMSAENSAAILPRAGRAR